jgi:hypothetical protein
MWQGERSAPTLQNEWAIFRSPDSSGITVQKETLQSIHTHWAEKSDKATSEFNSWVLTFLARLSSVKKTQSLMRFLSKIV